VDGVHDYPRVIELFDFRDKLLVVIRRQPFVVMNKVRRVTREVRLEVFGLRRRIALGYLVREMQRLRRSRTLNEGLSAVSATIEVIVGRNIRWNRIRTGFPRHFFRLRGTSNKRYQREDASA